MTDTDSYELGCGVGQESKSIDARIYGSTGRFVNQLCDPNVEFRALVKYCGDNFKDRNGIFAKRMIKKGEELMILYRENGSGGDGDGEEETKCCCGTKSCHGFL